MKTLTDRQRQWMWFVLLWCSGLLAALGLSYLARWMLSP